MRLKREEGEAAPKGTLVSSNGRLLSCVCHLIVSRAEAAAHDSYTRSINIEEGLESRRPRSFSVNETGPPVMRSICGAAATSPE